MIMRGEMGLLPYGAVMLAGPILDLAIVAGVLAILRRPLAGFAAGSGFLDQGTYPISDRRARHGSLAAPSDLRVASTPSWRCYVPSDC
jgi:hypothetical protein